jgi:hypothetical protein
LKYLNISILSLLGLTSLSKISKARGVDQGKKVRGEGDADQENYPRYLGFDTILTCIGHSDVSSQRMVRKGGECHVSNLSSHPTAGSAFVGVSFLIGTEVSHMTSFAYADLLADQSYSDAKKVRDSYLGFGPSFGGGVTNGRGFRIWYDIGPKVIVSIRSTMGVWDEPLPFMGHSDVVTTFGPVSISPVVVSISH